MTTSATEVAVLLRERILSGEIPPGTRLQQIPLSEELGVSRTPLREALALLAIQGLLIYEPNRGYAVRTFSLTEITSAFDVRARLEALACGICSAKGLHKAVLGTLQDCVGRGDAILAKGILDPADLAPYRQMNVEFHETIIREAGNPLIAEFVKRCHDIPLASDRVFVWENFKVIARSHDDHHRILEAITGRDVERADYLMREHIRFAGQVLVRRIGIAGDIAQPIGWHQVDRGERH